MVPKKTKKVVGQRRVLDAINPISGSMGVVPILEAEEVTFESASMQKTFDRTMDNLRFGVTHLTRRLLAQGPNTTLSEADYASVVRSTETLATTLEAACSLIESLHSVGTSEAWISTDVQSVMSDLAQLIQTSSRMDAQAVTSPEVIGGLTRDLKDCAVAFRKSAEAVTVLRSVSTPLVIEEKKKDTVISMEDFKRTVKGADRPESPSPQELPLWSGSAPATRTFHPSLRDQALLTPDPKADSGLMDMTERAEKAAEQPVRVCERCGFEEFPKGFESVPVVTKGPNDKLTCFSCKQILKAQEANGQSMVGLKED